MAEREGTCNEEEKGRGEAETGGAEENGRPELAGVEDREGGETTSELSGGSPAD